MTNCITKFCALFFFVRIYLLKFINNSSSYTKEHMTVTIVGHLILMRIGFYDFISQFFFSFSFNWEDISNTLDSVCPHLQTPRCLSNIPSAARRIFSRFSVFRDTVNFTVFWKEKKYKKEYNFMCENLSVNAQYSKMS